MGFIKEYKQLFNRINEELDKWEKVGVKPNKIRYAENLIERFYEWVGKSPKNDNRFSTRLKYTEEQENELEEIAQSIANNFMSVEDEYSEQFVDQYEKVKNKMGFKTIEDFKNWVDAKDRFKTERLISSVIGWYEYEKLKQRYSKKHPKLTEKQVESYLNKKITNVYLKHGFEREQLYDFVYEHI